jgi:hypothetical protein
MSNQLWFKTPFNKDSFEYFLCGIVNEFSKRSLFVYYNDIPTMGMNMRLPALKW